MTPNLDPTPAKGSERQGAPTLGDRQPRRGDGAPTPVHVSHRTGSDWHSYDASLEAYGNDYALLRLEDGQELIFDRGELTEALKAPDPVERFAGQLPKRRAA